MRTHVRETLRMDTPRERQWEWELGCVREREKVRERDIRMGACVRHYSENGGGCLFVCVCAWVREREKSHQQMQSLFGQKDEKKNQYLISKFGREDFLIEEKKSDRDRRKLETSFVFLLSFGGPAVVSWLRSPRFDASNCWSHLNQFLSCAQWRSTKK